MLSNVTTDWQLLISVTPHFKLLFLRELLVANNIAFVEMNKIDSAYPLLFSEIDIFVAADKLIDAKLLLIENQVD